MTTIILIIIICICCTTIIFLIRKTNSLKSENISLLSKNIAFENQITIKNDQLNELNTSNKDLTISTINLQKENS